MPGIDTKWDIVEVFYVFHVLLSLKTAQHRKVGDHGIWHRERQEKKSVSINSHLQRYGGLNEDIMRHNQRHNKYSYSFLWPV